MTSSAETRSILFIVRHGECMGNISRKILSPEDAVLTDTGKQQAALLGELLRTEKFTLAYASDYPRARETAEIILSKSEVSQEIPLQKTEKLREKNLGVFEGGVDIAEFIKAFVSSGEDFLDFKPTGGETRMEVVNRIESFLQEIFTKVDESEEVQTILAVTHGAVILHALAYLAKTPNKYTFKNWQPNLFKVSPNTGYFKIAIQKNPQLNAPRELEILEAHGKQHLIALKADTLHKFTFESEKMASFKGCIQQ